MERSTKLHEFLKLLHGQREREEILAMNQDKKSAVSLETIRKDDVPEALKLAESLKYNPVLRGENVIVVSRYPSVSEALVEAFQRTNHMAIGLLLGYPRKDVEAYINRQQKIVEEVNRCSPPSYQRDVSKLGKAAFEEQTLRMLECLKKDAERNKEAIELLEGIHELSGAFTPEVTAKTPYRIRCRKIQRFWDEKTIKKWERHSTAMSWNNSDIILQEEKKEYLRRFGYPESMAYRSFGKLPRDLRDRLVNECAREFFLLRIYFQSED